MHLLRRSSTPLSSLALIHSLCRCCLCCRWRRCFRWRQCYWSRCAEWGRGTRNSTPKTRVRALAEELEAQETSVGNSDIGDGEVKLTPHRRLEGCHQFITRNQGRKPMLIKGAGQQYFTQPLAFFHHKKRISKPPNLDTTPRTCFLAFQPLDQGIFGG